MGNLSTFGTFTMARLGIYVSQQALNVTGNNIANINTDGYTREALDQRAMNYGSADRYISELEVRESGGVLSVGVNQLRDQYLDIRYRNEMTKVGAMDTRLKGLEDLAKVFDEVAKGEDGEGVLEARFNDLIQQFENLSQPGNIGTDTADSLVRKAAEAITRQFNDYAERLSTIEKNMTAEFHDQVEDANMILDKIRDLNTSIRKSDIFGGNALVQRDERNVLLDRLSEKVGINVTYEMEKLSDGREVEKIVVKTANEPQRTLVDGRYVAQLAIVQRGGDVAKVADDGSIYYEKNNVDVDNFDLAVTELTDVNGTPNIFPTNNLETQITKFEPVAKSDKDHASSFDRDEATEIVRMLNSDPDYALDSTDPEKAYYYHLSNENGKYYIHQHTVTRAAYDAAIADYANEANQEVKAAKEKAFLEGAQESLGNDVDFSYTAVTAQRLTPLTDTELTGGLQAMRELLTEEGEYADAADLVRDPEAGSKRGVPYYRQALDTLAREFARAMNEANTIEPAELYQSNGVRTGYRKNAAGTSYVDANGNDTGDANKFVTVYLDKDGNETTDPNEYTIYVDEKGNPTTDPTKYVIKDEYKDFYNGGALFTDNGDSSGKVDKGAANITAANISVAYGWSHGTTRVLRSKEPDAQERSTEQTNIDHFITLLTSERRFEFGTKTEGTTFFKGTFQDMLTDSIAGTLAKDQNITTSMLGNYNATADELYVSRDSIMGVDLNDEAMNMMMFQKAYSAACRLMTTYDGMLDKLINGTAV